MATTFNSTQYKAIKEYFNDGPYLVHKSMDFLKIIESKYVKPASETKNRDYSDGLIPDDEYLPYCYFSITDSALVYHLMPVTIIFKPDFLVGRDFYMNQHWLVNPNEGVIRLNSKPPIKKLLTEQLAQKCEWPKHFHQYCNEIMVEKRVAIKNMIVGIVLYGVNKIENIESNIAKYNALMEKKPDDQIKKTLTRYQTRLAENMRLLRYCAKNNIAIIYKK